MPPQRAQGPQQLALDEETLGRHAEKRVQRNSERLCPCPEASPCHAMAVPSCHGRPSGEGGQRLGSVRLEGPGGSGIATQQTREDGVISTVTPKGPHDLKLLLTVPRDGERPGASDAAGLPVLILVWGAVDLGNGAVPADSFY